MNARPPPPPRDPTAPENCPHCTRPFHNHLAMWRHKQQCDNNPDPTCEWCELKFDPHKLPAHERKCGKNPANISALRRSRPSNWIRDMPRERLTATDLIVLPLTAEPWEVLPPISETARSPPPDELLVDPELIWPETADEQPPTNRKGRRRRRAVREERPHGRMAERVREALHMKGSLEVRFLVLAIHLATQPERKRLRS